MFYVTSTDMLMSYWGMSRGKINKVIVVCNTEEEAKAIFTYLKSVNSFKYVNILDKMPIYKSNKYYVSVEQINNAQYWLNEGRKIIKNKRGKSNEHTR